LAVPVSFHDPGAAAIMNNPRAMAQNDGRPGHRAIASRHTAFNQGVILDASSVLRCRQQLLL
jgi:hypothetical protein